MSVRLSAIATLPKAALRSRVESLPDVEDAPKHKGRSASRSWAEPRKECRDMKDVYGWSSVSTPTSVPSPHASRSPRKRIASRMDTLNSMLSGASTAAPDADCCGTMTSLGSFVSAMEMEDRVTSRPGSAMQRKEREFEELVSQMEELNGQLQASKRMQQLDQQALTIEVGKTAALQARVEELQERARTRERQLEQELLQSRLALRAAQDETESLRKEVREGQKCSFALDVNVGCSDACRTLRCNMDEVERQRAVLECELEAQKLCCQDSMGEQVCDLQDENERLQDQQEEMMEYIEALKTKFKKHMKQSSEELREVLYTHAELEQKFHSQQSQMEWLRMEKEEYEKELCNPDMLLHTKYSTSP